MRYSKNGFGKWKFLPYIQLLTWDFWLQLINLKWYLWILSSFKYIFAIVSRYDSYGQAFLFISNGTAPIRVLKYHLGISYSFRFKEISFLKPHAIFKCPKLSYKHFRIQFSHFKYFSKQTFQNCILFILIQIRTNSLIWLAERQSVLSP